MLRKKWFAFALLSFLNPAVFAAPTHSSQTIYWSQVGHQDLMSHKHIGSSSMAIGPEGIPYIAYTDLDNHSQITVLKYSSTSNQWETVGSIEGLAQNATYADIAIGRSDDSEFAYDVPYVVYTGGDSKCHGLVVKKYDEIANQWTTVSDPNDQFNCLTKDAYNNKIDASGKRGTFSLAYNDPSIFTTNMALYSDADGFQNNSGISVEHTNEQQITFATAAIVAFRIQNSSRIQVYKNGDYPNFLGDNTLPSPVSTMSLTTDKNNSLYLGFLQGNPRAGNASVYKFVDPTKPNDPWISMGDISLGGLTSTLNLAIANNAPYLAYSLNDNQLMVKKFDGTTWVDFGSPIATDTILNNTIMKTAPNGHLFLAYTHCAKDTSDCSITVLANQQTNSH